MATVPPIPAGAAAAAAAAAAASATTTMVNNSKATTPAMMVVVAALYVLAWVFYILLIRETAQDFNHMSFLEKSLIAAIEILMGCALMIPLAALIANLIWR
jgi:hypothetical protein